MKNPVAFVIGLLALAASVFLFQRNQNLVANGIERPATVTQIEVKKFGQKNRYRLHLQFIDHQGKVRTRDFSWKDKKPNYREGQQIKVAYDPRRPQELQLGGISRIPWIALVAGIIGVFFCWAGLAGPGKRRPETH